MGSDSPSAWDPLKTIPIITVKQFPRCIWKFNLPPCNSLDDKFLTPSSALTLAPDQGTAMLNHRPWGSNLAATCAFANLNLNGPAN